MTSGEELQIRCYDQQFFFFIAFCCLKLDFPVWYRQHLPEIQFWTEQNKQSTENYISGNKESFFLA